MMSVRQTSPALLAVSLLLGVVPVRAQESFYRVHPDRGLMFADLEFAMATDPLLPSAIGLNHVIHTPAPYLSDAASKLRAAVPAGTEAAAEAAILTKAGARCVRQTGDALACRYRDVETPWGGDYFDSISWTVTMPLAGGHVTDLAVTRDWLRR